MLILNFLGHCSFFKLLKEVYSLLLLIVFIPVIGFSQLEYQNSFHYTHDDGLPSATTYDIVQDSAGYIWIATEAGISRFNGNQFKNFGLKEGLVQNEVVTMNQDKSNRIWLNSTGSTSFMKNGEFVSLESTEKTNLIWSFQVVEDSDRDIWIATSREIQRLDGQTFELKKLPENLNLRTNYSQLIGTKQDSLIIRNDKSLIFIVGDSITRQFAIPNSQSLDSIRWTKSCLKGDKLYYCSSEGLALLNLSTQEFKVIDKEIQGARKLMVEDNNIFVSEPEASIKVLKIDRDDEVISSYKLLEGILCSSFTIDDQDNLWVATYKSGCFMFPKQTKQIIGYPATEYKQFQGLETIFVEGDTIWYGNSKAELIKQVGSEFEVFNLNTNSIQSIVRILEIERSQKGNLYFSTDHGVFVFKNGRPELKLKTSAKKIHLFGDSLLINTYNTCFQVSDTYFSEMEEPQIIQEFEKNENVKIIEPGRTFASMVDSKGNKWIGNVEKGLIKITPSGYRIYFKDLSPIFSASITEIIELDNGWVCASTNGEGLLFPENTEFSQIDIEQGLSSDVCFDLNSIGNKLYVGTNKGISVIDFENKGENFYPINVIDQVNGLISNEVRNLAYKDDELLIASPKGLSVYKFSDDIIEEDNSPLIFETIEINSEEQPISKSYDLKPNENNIVIKFNALAFKRNDQVIYAYKMSGVDKDWIYTRNNETHYSNLTSGEYTFEVRHVNQDKEGKVSRVNFKINSTFINTTSFKVLMGLLFLAFVYGFYNIFTSRRRRLLLQQMVAEKTLELNEKVVDLADANEKLEDSNKELERFASVTSHDLKSPLRAIGSFLQLYKRKNEKNFDEKDKVYMDYVTAGVNKMDRIIKDLLSLSKIGSHDQEYRIEDTKEVILSAIDSLPYIFVDSNTDCKLKGEFPSLLIQKTEFELIFQNLVTNGVKYNESENKLIEINCDEKEDHYTFVVSDNGIGIDPKYGEKVFDVFQRLHSDGKYSGTGIGLSICKKIVDKNGGKLWFDSSEKGTTFYFNWPKAA